MDKRYLLALDEGTSSARAMVFDTAGKSLGLGRRNFEQHYPQPGWVEHDAEEIWQAQLEATKEALASASIAADQIAAIGITNQRETLVVWDRKTGKPIHNAIVWQDRRTADFCKKLVAEGHEKSVREKTGLVIDSYFSATKLRWILDHVDGARAKAEAGQLAAGTIDTWLLWNLTGGKVHATDVSNASRTMAFNIHTLDWDAELEQILGLPESEKIWPMVNASAGRFGETTLFGRSIPITGIAGDQQSAMFGQGCYRAGMAKNTYGTGCFLLMNTGPEAKVSHHRLLTTIAWQVGNKVTYALEGAIFSAGASLQWLEQVGIYHGTTELDKLDASIEDSEGVYFVPAFAGLGAPQWDPNARGTLLGLTRGTEKAHLVRAALDAMAYQSDEVLQLMVKDSGLPLTELRVDGGISVSDRLMQLQADLSGVQVNRPEERETTALGAALLAGIGAGIYPNLDALEQVRKTERTFEADADYPQESNRKRWQQAIERSQNWAEA
jgi:glycerol kinase